MVMLGLLPGAVLGRPGCIASLHNFHSLPARVRRGVLRCCAGLVTRVHMRCTRPGWEWDVASVSHVWDSWQLHYIKHALLKRSRSCGNGRAMHTMSVC